MSRYCLAPTCWIAVGNESARTCVSKLTLNSSPETREGCRSAGNLCWLGTRVHPARQKQPPAEQTRSGEITWRRRKKKTTRACNIMTDGWIMKRVSNEKKVRRREQAGNRADENQTESDRIWLKRRGLLMKESSAVPPPTLNSVSAPTHMCVCVLHFHCCQNRRLDLCGIWGSAPARTDPDLQLKTLAQEKWDSRSNSTLETTCQLLSPLPIRA